MKFTLPVLAAALVLTASAAEKEEPASESVAPVVHVSDASGTPRSLVADARLDWWRDTRFGMFIHWNPSCVTGVEISWDRKAARPMETVGGRMPERRVDPEYDTLPARFNPVNFNAREWVDLAKSTGMGYMVFTTKHHDGFANWPTRAREDHNISKTPWKDGKGDILRELADAAHAGGMRLGWYYSPRDWTHPDYGVGDNAKYEAFMEKQVTEILSDYGKIDLLWWDSFGKGDSLKYWHAPKFNELAHRLQPGIVINDRCNYYHEKNKRPETLGDFDTPEQVVGKYQIDRPWESCITLVADHWSFRPGGRLMNADGVIRTLVSCATGDGNLLLNVGPMADGRIEPRQVEVLRQVGEWMSLHGETIRRTRGGPFRNGRWGGATFRGDTVYLHLLPGTCDTLLLPPLGVTLKSAASLTGGKVEVTEQNGRVRIHRQPGAPKVPDAIIELKFSGPVRHVPGSVEFPTPASK